MKPLDILLCIACIVIGLGGALYSMWQFSSRADALAAREQRRQASLAACDSAGRGYLEKDDAGQWWCTLYPLGNSK